MYELVLRLVDHMKTKDLIYINEIIENMKRVDRIKVALEFCILTRN